MNPTIETENYTLYHGDCLEQMALLPDASIDCICTDPPYGTTACKWDAVIAFEPMWEQLKRLIKPHGAIVLFGSQPFTSALVMSNPKMFKYCWVWRKTRASNFATAKYHPLKGHEDIAVFSVGVCHYFPQMVESVPYYTRTQIRRCGDGVFGGMKRDEAKRELRTCRFPMTVIDAPSMRQQDRLHPTQKPVALMEYLIKTYTNEGETVLDFTFGSCSTGAAAMNTNRKFIGIERDETYFNIGAKRLAEASAQRQFEYSL